MAAYRSMVSGLALAAIFGGVCVTNTANAASQVILKYGIDGVSNTMTFDDGDDGNIDGFISGSFNFELNGNILSGQFSALEDPTINLSVSAIDDSSPDGFFVIATLVTDIAPGAYSYDLTGSGSYTDGDSRNGVGVAPLPNRDGVFIGEKETTIVAAIGDKQLTGNPNHVPLSATYGPFDESGTTLVCASGCSQESLAIAWVGSGNGDSYAFTGQFQNKTVVPLPAALPLMISALAAVGIVGMRRHS